MSFVLSEVAKLLPLLPGRISARWVVGTTVEKDNTRVRRVVQILKHARYVDTLDCRVIVAILLPFQACAVRKRLVISPRGSWNVHASVTIPPFLKKGEPKANRSSSRKGLTCGYAIFCNSFRVVAVE
jgi:hypothetical protein